ncbi:MAG: hypothetical protein K6G53_07165 [Bacteroidales bacterium]|nr:hypothetical protein [Bacteroidales bacterium]
MATKTSLKKVLLLVLTVSALCSCTDYSKIKFSDFRVNSVDSLRYSLTDMRGIVHSVLTVDNPYFAMTLKDFEAAVVSPEGSSILEVSMYEGTVLQVAAKDVTELEAPLRVHVSNPLSLLARGLDAVQDMGKEGYVVNYSLSVAKGNGTRYHKISKKNVPLDSFIKTEE